MANILFLTGRAPFPIQEDGLTLRFHPVLQHLGSRHSVDLLIGGDDRPNAADWAREAGKVCRNVKSVPKRSLNPVQRGIRTAGGIFHPLRPPWEVVRPWTVDYYREAVRFLSGTPYDAVLAAGCYDLLSFVVRFPLENTRLVLDWVDSPSLHYERVANLRSGLRRRIALKRLSRLKRWERGLNRQLESAIYVAEPDARYANGSGASNVVVIPNGVLPVPPDHIREDASQDRPLTLGFLGNMGYQPNVLAVERLHSKIYLPLKEHFPELRLKIIGRTPEPEIEALRSPSVEVTGEVESIWPHLFDVDVMVFPLEVGAGLQNKILESIAAGCPVVATSLSTSGCGKGAADAVLVADTDSHLRAATASLLSSHDRREEVRLRAMKLLRDFNWSDLLVTYEDVLLGS